MYSFVIPAYNEQDYIGITIDEIHTIFKSLDTEIKYEIIVCDNNSTDRTAEIARDKFCTVVQCSERSISKARNTGAQVTTGEWIIFLDADSYPSRSLIKEILNYNTDYIGFGAIVKVIGGTRWFRFALESKNWSMKTFNWCLGGFICCRKVDYIEIGGFDEEIYAFEEEYFIKKLRKIALQKNKYFKVLDYCFYTSGRKSEIFGMIDMLKLVLSIWFNKKKAIRNKNKMKYWYK